MSSTNIEKVLIIGVGLIGSSIARALKEYGITSKIYGIDRIDDKKDIYVVEGPFDSLFVENCIAVAQSDLRVSQYKEKSILIPDNEPRNKELCKQIKKFIDNNYRIVLWPSAIKEKDINEMILSGKTKKEIKTIIDNNTYQGTKALMQFSMWRKVNV